ncbi:asparaginase [Polaromonas sp. JS666]|uniref:asparaginase n=1 Tax=Polaromonas sp. (strain JS666 / ATCC BAA-500) TaxID=296591 RepID=UPI0009F52C16|nr:asparaginase [Polaromonas sp. JS666]
MVETLMRKTRIAVLGTGGTIAGEASSASDVLSYQDSQLSAADTLAPLAPYLPKEVELLALQISQLGSENFSTDTWLLLAHAISRLDETEEPDGFVLTQGTDTLEETAYFLHLALKTAKPVVVVGAMRPATAISADGPLNLLRAVQLAASPQVRGFGVMVVANERIFSAREVTKSHTSSIDSFCSPEFGCVGYMQNGDVKLHRMPSRHHTLNSPFSVSGLQSLPKVDIVYAYAGAGSESIRAFLDGGTRGLVHAGTGNGSISSIHQMAYREAILRGVAVVRSSRTGSGLVSRNGAVDDDAFGSISSDTLSPQKARVLLSLALTLKQDATELQRYFDHY